MITRLKTSKETQEIFQKVAQTTGLQPYVMSKIAISLSLRTCTPLKDDDFVTDNEGLDLNRQTICGEYDSLFSSLIAMNEKIVLDEESIFPKYFKGHIDRGAKILFNEYKYDKNFFTHMCKLKEGI